MSVINIMFLTFALVLFAQYPFSQCLPIQPKTTSEESANNIAPDVKTSDVILVPVLQEALNDVVMTNLHAMLPDKLVVISGSETAPSGVSINTDGLKVLGTVSVTNAVTFVDLPVVPTAGLEQDVKDGGNATDGESDVASPDIVLPVLFD